MAYVAVAALVTAAAAGILAGRAITRANHAARAADDFANTIRHLRDLIDRKTINVAVENIDDRVQTLRGQLTADIDERIADVAERLARLEDAVAASKSSDPNVVIASMKDFAQSILYGPGRDTDTGSSDGLIVGGDTDQPGDLHTTPDWTDDLIDTGVDLNPQFPPPPDLGQDDR